MKSRTIQQHYLQLALSFVAGWKHLQQWEPVQALWRVKYDETPLRMRARFAAGRLGQGNSEQEHLDAQILKLFVHECSWSLMLRPAARAVASESDYLVIKGHFGAECRTVDRATGEGIACVVASCHTPPAQMRELFSQTVRVVESDSLPANGKAERILQESETWAGWRRFTMPCMAHRIHASVTRTLTLASMKPLVTGLKNTLLFMRSPGVLPEFRAHIKTVLRDKMVVMQGGPEISAYRERMIEAFVPERTSGEVVVLFAMITMFNGNWCIPASHQIEHRCQGCCANREACVEKAAILLNRVVTCCRPQTLCPGNWRSWHKSFPFIGLLASMHGVLFELLQRTLHSLSCKTSASDSHEFLLVGSVQVQDEHVHPFLDLHSGPGSASDANRVDNTGANAVDDTEMAQWRALESEKREKTKDFMALPLAVEKCYVVLKALEPERKLMSAVLEADSGLWDVAEMGKLMKGSIRKYRLRVLSDAAQTSLREWGALLCSPMDSWSHLTPSSVLGQSIQVSVLHAAAVVYEGVIIPRRGWGWRVFDIISDPSVAEELISSPPCLQDAFVQYFCGLFPTLEEMKGAEARAWLLHIYEDTSGHTFSTERIHSKNQRYAHSRVQTHLIDLPFLSAHHQEVASNAWHRQLCHHSSHSALATRTRARKRDRRGGPRGAKRGLSEQTGDGEQRQKKKKKEVARPGGGGAWRAFLHLEGQSMKGNMAKLSAKFAGLSEQERARLKELGQAATAAHRSGAVAFLPVSVTRTTHDQPAPSCLPQDQSHLEFGVLLTAEAALENRRSSEIALAESDGKISFASAACQPLRVAGNPWVTQCSSASDLSNSLRHFQRVAKQLRKAAGHRAAAREDLEAQCCDLHHACPPKESHIVNCRNLFNKSLFVCSEQSLVVDLVTVALPELCTGLLL